MAAWAAAFAVAVFLGAFASRLMPLKVQDRVIRLEMRLRLRALLAPEVAARAASLPVKQLVAAFSPDNEYGFKRVVMVRHGERGWVLGFLTKEFAVDRGQGVENVVAVYVPTNHLYLGDIGVYPREQAFFPDISVEEGIRIFLTGGMSLPGRIKEVEK